MKHLDLIFRALDVGWAIVITVAVFSWWFVIHSWRGPDEPEDVL